MVEILHPVHENPGYCPGKTRMTNPAELVLMTVNPTRGARRPFSERRESSRERARSFNPDGQHYAIRWHTGNISQAFRSQDEAQRILQRFHGKGEIIRVNPMPAGSERYRNPVGAEPAQAREIREGFTHSESKRYRVVDEPLIPAGDYAELGKMDMLAVKPTPTGTTNQVQEIPFEPDVILISGTSRRQMYFAGGDQKLTAREVRIFTSAGGDRIDLGECHAIAYLATKYHPEVENSAAGKEVPWIHKFGEENGIRPRLFYHPSLERFSLEGGSYRVEDAGIVN